MSWIHPTGHQARAGDWANVERVYDSDLATGMNCIATGPGHWCSPVTFLFPTTLSDAVRLYFAPTAGDISYRIQVQDAGEWYIVEFLVNPASSKWIVIKFEPHWITELEIAFHRPSTEYPIGGPTEIEAWQTCGGPLAAICRFFGDVGDFFSGLADDIAGVFIIGEHLAAPFNTLGEWFVTVSNTCCQASAALQDILDKLAEGISVLDFAALLEEHFPLLYYLIVDTPGQVRYLIAQAFDLTPYEAQNAEFIVKALFERYFPSLYRLWRDPQLTLGGWLEEHFPLLYYLIVDPKGQMLYLLAQLFDLTPWEAQSAEFMVKALFERYFPELYLIWRDPMHWLVDMLLSLEEEIVRPIADKLQKLGEHLLRLMWEGEW